MKAGHVRQRSPGSYELRWRAGSKVLSETINAKSQRAAEVELAKRVSASEAGQFSKAPARLTCADWFDQWHASLTFAELTKANYRSTLNVWLIPELGEVKLKELSAITIKTAFLRMAKRGKAASTLGQVRNVLASALRSAVKFDMLTHNPLDKLRGELPIARRAAG